jgi:ADP-heptose:LPS heptosyltransferase
MRQRRFDLALQMHGSGDIVNAFVAQLGARTAAGFALPGTQDGLDLAVPWPRQGTELERCLALTDALGCIRDGLHLDFPLADSDRRDAACLLADAGVSGRYAILHPGAQLPSRRWAPARFALVADALASQNLSLVITGSAAEAPLAAALRNASRRPLFDLTGRTPSLWSLGALVESATLVISNDTGISHVAVALRTPSVVVASGSDVARWAPLNHDLHRVHWHATPCRPCAHAVCPTAHECATGVSPAAVAASALALLGD